MGFGLVQGLGRDIFWPPSPFNLTTSLQGCNRTWGAMPRNQGISSSQGKLNYVRVQNATAFYGGQGYGQWNSGEAPCARRILQKLRTLSFQMDISTPGAQVCITGLFKFSKFELILTGNLKSKSRRNTEEYIGYGGSLSHSIRRTPLGPYVLKSARYR